jgi:hypothetical protein
MFVCSWALALPSGCGPHIFIGGGVRSSSARCLQKLQLWLSSNLSYIVYWSTVRLNAVTGVFPGLYERSNWGKPPHSLALAPPAAVGLACRSGWAAVCWFCLMFQGQSGDLRQKRGENSTALWLALEGDCSCGSVIIKKNCVNRQLP